MKITSATKLPTQGHYVVAVSGGVDSVALLHMLVHQPGQQLRLRVAHVNHRLRDDADADERLVRELAKGYDLPFHSTRLELGRASEETFRRARYQFLHQVLAETGATAIITAHHADDQHETSLFNALRGSARRGLAANLQSQNLLRPLLNLSKSQIYDYARSHGLAWREDSTNRDLTIDRNFIRHELLRTDSPAAEGYRQVLNRHRAISQILDQKLERLIYDLGSSQPELNRRWLAVVSWPVLAEVLAHLVARYDPEHQPTRRQIDAMVQFCKTAPTGATFAVSPGLKLQVGYDTVAIVLDQPASPPQSVARLRPEATLQFGPLRLSYGSFQRGETGMVMPPDDYIVRAPQFGDRIKTSVGTKKLQDLFVDRKIGPAKRRDWPIITRAGIVVLVPLLAVARDLAKATAGYHLIVEEV